MPKSAANHTFCALFTQKVRFSALVPLFWALFLGSAGTPLFVQINVFAVWALRLDRKIHNPDEKIIRTDPMVRERINGDLKRVI